MVILQLDQLDRDKKVDCKEFVPKNVGFVLTNTGSEIVKFRSLQGKERITSGIAR